MLSIRDTICEDIRKYNNFVPVYDTLTEAIYCVTDFEIESTLYREDVEYRKAIKEAYRTNKPVRIGSIGPLKSIYNGVDYVDVYVTKDHRYLTKRINKK